MAEDKIGTYRFVAEPFHVDFTGHLTLGFLGNHLLNVAGFHAADRGFGMKTLNSENYTWVLSRLAIEMKDLPLQYEPFTVQTWVRSVYRFFTDRCFAVLNKDGEAVAYAQSVWAMINTSTRKPADLMAIHGGNITDYICDKACPIDKPSRVKVTGTEPQSVLDVKYSDIDINGHVNSIRYIEHVMDLFPVDMYREKQVRRFEIAYVAESMAGDKLHFYVDRPDDSNFNVEIRKNGTDVVARSRMSMEYRNK